MILIQHKWMKNRNLLSNRTVLSFDDQGIARVKKIGYAMEDIEAIIKRFPGQISIVNEIKSEPVVEVKIKAEEKPVIAPPQDVKKKKQPVVKQKTEEN